LKKIAKIAFCGLGLTETERDKSMDDLQKQRVHDFWNASACGEELYLSGKSKADFEMHAQIRYQLEPYIPEFAEFSRFNGKKVLEIGVGLGAEHQRFAEAGAELHGVDLTERAIQNTKLRFSCFGLTSSLAKGDAESLEYPDDFFDLVYSWGVLHHSPNTQQAIGEVHRVLKPDGVAKIMIYHTWSMIGLMLYLRYGLLSGRPFRSLRSIYAAHLESPGTKAYSKAEARELFSRFSDVKISTVLTHGDLLESGAGQRHRGVSLSIARVIWPRWFIRKFLANAGLFMLIEARK
jgi:2-polyprenyl-3-methyl-5-hydroxy-6-metoxy-1,4-benzoquinol methylase